MRCRATEKRRKIKRTVSDSQKDFRTRHLFRKLLLISGKTMEVEAAYPLSFIPYCKGMPFPTSFLFLIEGTLFKEVS